MERPRDVTFTDEVASRRKPDYEILPLFLNRWSPRSMSGELLSDDEIFPLFEAARWAPSSYNAQLWRFIVARRQDPTTFSAFLNLLTAGNAEWAKDAAALVVVVSGQRFEFNGRPSITHVFDAGAAWENLALEAARRGLVAHGMQGFDYARAARGLGVPADYDVLAMIAIGKRGPLEKLHDRQREAEHPNDRRPLKDILFEGAFGRPIVQL
jgi:nitroreductase